MKTISFIILLSLLMISCTNKKNVVNPEVGNETSDYVQGEVAFGLKDSVALEDIAYYIYSRDNISIEEIVSFQYLSNLSQDSIQTIKTTLESKSYIWDETVRTTYIDEESKILVEFWIKNFRKEDIENWYRLRSRFQLYHSPYYFQSGILKVEIGKEKKWIEMLSISDLFRFVELNGIVHTH